MDVLCKSKDLRVLFFRAEKAVKQALLMLCVKNATEQQESVPEAPVNASIAEMQSQTAIPEECKISHQKEDINAKRTRRFFSVLLTLAMLLTLVPAAVSAAGTYPATSAVSVDGKLIYNGAGQAYETASISGITAGANPGWTYAYVPSGTGSLDASGKPQNAGTYTVTATYEDDDNYGTKSAVLEIKKAETK